MNVDKDTLISQQRDRLFASLAMPHIVKACTVEDGILSLDEASMERYRSVFHDDASSLAFFIPASGSGSRMFDFLQQFLGTMGQESTDEVRLFFSELSNFAFFPLISEEWQKSIATSEVDLLAFCEYLLGAKGLNFSNIPKALFPFHNLRGKLYSPLEGHLQQGYNLSKKVKEFHFTVQQEHAAAVQLKIEEHLTSIPVQVHLSIQSPESDSFVYDEFQQALTYPSGEYIKRPSGHGALLENLNRVSTELVLIKNIDNVQCPGRDSEINQYWEVLSGLFLEVQQEIKHVIDLREIQRFHDLNERFHLFDPGLANASWEHILAALKRPLRVCGMVRNEGMAGGGPFWCKDGGYNSKQIIEKSQIDPIHLALLAESTHFNPVMMVASPFDRDGNRYEFSAFVKEDMSMAVKKNHFGKTVYYLEKPGLWNGSMFYWNSLFVEIPSSVFSPVKNVMDLLKSEHICH